MVEIVEKQQFSVIGKMGKGPANEGSSGNDPFSPSIWCYSVVLNFWWDILNKLVLIPILILLSITLTGCNLFESKSNLPIEMVAFNSLTDEEKDLIPVSPKDSIVKQVPVNNDTESLIDKNYDKDQVYSITFNNTETDSSGNLLVFVDLDKKTVVGKGFTSK